MQKQIKLIMSNKYGIPENDLNKIKARDKNCVYCHKKMINPKNGGRNSDWATIEYLNFLPLWDNPSTVAICCQNCNSSRGKKKLLDWFKTPYCIKKNINENTVAKSVKTYLRLIKNSKMEN